MKNNEGYKDPTASKAVAMEAMREKLRQQYNVKEGQTVKLSFTEKDSSGYRKKKTVKATVEQIYKHFVLLRYPAGYCESVDWMKFKQSRVDT